MNDVASRSHLEDEQGIRCRGKAEARGFPLNPKSSIYFYFYFWTIK